MELFLINFSNLNDARQNKKLQSKLARSYCNYILKEKYNLNCELEKDEKGKPYLKNSELKISISHSNGIVALLFDWENIGVDIEYKKERNFDKILKHLNIDKKNIEADEFYKIWTSFEACYKFDNEKKQPCNFLCFLYKNYVCSIASFKKIEPEIYEITIPKNKSNDIKNFDFDDTYDTIKEIKVKIMPSISF